MDDSGSSEVSPAEVSDEPVVRRWYMPWTWLSRAGTARVLTLAAIVVTVVLVVKGYNKGGAYAQKVVEQKAETIQFSFSLANPPAGMSRQTIAEIRSQIEKYSNHDIATYRRFQNPLDKEILGTISAYYTAHDFVGMSGKPEDRPTIGASAWIKKVMEVRRVIRPDRGEQWFEIYAEYRRPAAVVAVPVNEKGERIRNLAAIVDPAKVPAMKYYLIDGEQVRLPGEFAKNPFAATYMTIYGVDEDVPAPGSAWKAPEVAEGLKLAATLHAQPFWTQIALINMTNFGGRAAKIPPNDAVSAQITLQTTLGTRVLWGRPMGSEGLYEVKPSRKVANLVDVVAQFSRIDAGREWIDVRNEDPKVKSLPRAEGAIPKPARPRPRV